MAHFAEIDSDNKVIRVLVIPDNQEHRGQEYLAEDLQLGGKWVQTSYNDKIRGVFAGEGYFYDSDKDIFVEPKAEEQEGYVAESETNEVNAETL